MASSREQVGGFWSGLFGQQTSRSTGESSVLEEWNKYSNEGPLPTDEAFNQMERGSSLLQQAWNQSFSRVTEGVQNVSAGASNQLSSLQMPSGQQLAYFAAILAAGIFFLVTAFSVFLPVIILAPSKFAVCFTVGSLLVMVAFASLQGASNQLRHMLTAERIPFTAAYLASMGGTLYAALGLHSYALSLLFCAVQVLALLYYSLSYFPGGRHGLNYIFYMLKATASRCYLAIFGH